MTLHRDEEFVTKSEAYKGIGARLQEINRDIEDMEKAGRKGFEKKQAELNKEAKRLIDHMNRMESQITEEQSRESFEEGSEIMVENPFFTEGTMEVKDEELEIEAEPIKKEKDEVPTSQAELKLYYVGLKKRNQDINRAIQKLEAMEGQVIGMISAMSDPSMKMREELRKRDYDALIRLTQDYGSLAGERAMTELAEIGTRAQIQKMGLPEVLNTISESMETITDEKRKLLTNLSIAADRLNAYGKEEEKRSLKGGNGKAGGSMKEAA